MKKVLLTLIAVLMAVPAFAIEVYNNGEDTSVEIYGTIRGYLGYGMGMNGDITHDVDGVTSTTEGKGLDHNMLYGIQGNSRIGTRFKVGAVAGQVELGANESTLYMANAYTKKGDNNVGLRQAWVSYSFGNPGTILFGKTDTPTAMSGFISDVYDTDGGLNGFGGVTTGSRRFQIQYSIMGLTLALIEDDVADADGMVAGFTSGKKYTPRGAISYTFKNENLMAKVAATYTAVNGSYTDDNSETKWTNLHAFGITAGVRPTFGNSWLSVLARYGMNEDLYGEQKTVVNNGSFGHSTYSGISEVFTFGRSLNTEDGSFYNIHRVAVSLEYGIKLMEQFALIIGAGYQATIQDLPEIPDVEHSALAHSYAAFIQGKYDINRYFSFIPQIAWYGTIGRYSSKSGGVKSCTYDDNGGLLIGAQLRASF